MSPCGHINLLKVGNKKFIWEDLSREVAQIFDGTTVKARPRKRNTDVEGIGRARTSGEGYHQPGRQKSRTGGKGSREAKPQDTRNRSQSRQAIWIGSL